MSQFGDKGTTKKLIGVKTSLKGFVFQMKNGCKKYKKKQGRITPINPRPLLPSGPGGVSRDLVVLPCGCKDKYFLLKKHYLKIIFFKKINYLT